VPVAAIEEDVMLEAVRRWARDERDAFDVALV
jgi:hypothetical protein